MKNYKQLLSEAISIVNKNDNKEINDFIYKSMEFIDFIVKYAETETEGSINSSFKHLSTKNELLKLKLLFQVVKTIDGWADFTGLYVNGQLICPFSVDFMRHYLNNNDGKQITWDKLCEKQAVYQLKKIKERIKNGLHG